MRVANAARNEKLKHQSTDRLKCEKSWRRNVHKNYEILFASNVELVSLADRRHRSINNGRWRRIFQLFLNCYSTEALLIINFNQHTTKKKTRTIAGSPTCIVKIRRI